MAVLGDAQDAQVEQGVVKGALVGVGTQDLFGETAAARAETDGADG